MAAFWRIKNFRKLSNDTDPKQRLKQRRLRNLLVVCFCLVVIIIGPSLVHWVALSFEEHKLDRQLSELDARWNSLTKERERLESDPTYVEGLVRSTFKYGKPGEFVVMLDPNAVYETTR